MCSRRRRLRPSGYAATIPIVFGVAVDPVGTGLIASLNQPGGNLTGITGLNVELGPKRLELLRELRPTATTIALLVNPTGPSLAEPYTRALKAAAGTLGLQLLVLQARTEEDFDKVFTAIVQSRADALVIAPDTFFNTKSEKLAVLSLSPRAAGNLPVSPVCRGWRTYELRER
jgi:putative tryptophan/tyrosine transport system substrate-binding protein